MRAMLTKNRKLWVVLAWRQVFFLAVVAAIAGVHFAVTGNWIGWPLVIVTATFFNVAWCFVA